METGYSEYTLLVIILDVPVVLESASDIKPPSREKTFNTKPPSYKKMPFEKT